MPYVKVVICDYRLQKVRLKLPVKLALARFFALNICSSYSLGYSDWPCWLFLQCQNIP